MNAQEAAAAVVKFGIIKESDSELELRINQGIEEMIFPANDPTKQGLSPTPSISELRNLLKNFACDAFCKDGTPKPLELRLFQGIAAWTARKATGVLTIEAIPADVQTEAAAMTDAAVIDQLAQVIEPLSKLLAATGMELGVDILAIYCAWLARRFHHGFCTNCEELKQRNS